MLRKQWPGDVDAVLLAIHEAITNANIHGGGATGARAHLDGPTLFVEVCDCGGGFTMPPSNLVPGVLEESGRGLWIICQVASECAVHHGDGSVCLELRFDA